MSEFKCPRNLARFIAAVGAKLSGDQLRECIETANNDFHDSTLNSWETGVARWIMADDGMAEQYVAEHRAGLRKLEDMQRQCQYALEKLTGTDYRSNYTIGSELRGIISTAEDALKYIDELKAAAELKP